VKFFKYDTKIIHQICSDTNEPLPCIFLEFSQTWKNNHPDWKYEFWDNDRMNNFMKENILIVVFTICIWYISYIVQ